MSWSVDSDRSAITRKIRSFSVTELNLNAQNRQVLLLHVSSCFISYAVGGITVLTLLLLSALKLNRIYFHLTFFLLVICWLFYIVSFVVLFIVAQSTLIIFWVFIKWITTWKMGFLLIILFRPPLYLLLTIHNFELTIRVYFLFSWKN